VISFPVLNSQAPEWGLFFIKLQLNIYTNSIKKYIIGHGDIYTNSIKKYIIGHGDIYTNSIKR